MSDSRPPEGTSRRAFLTRSALLAAGATGVAACAGDEQPAGDAAAPAGSVLIPYAGEHQAGILAAAPSAGVVAGLDVLVPDRPALIELMRTVSNEIRQVMEAIPYPRREGGFPPLDTGTLGAIPPATGTAYIVGFGDSLFDRRFGLDDRRPNELVPMPHFPNDRMVTTERSHGDLSLVVQADTHDAAMHALRQVLRRTRGQLAVRWMREGFNTLGPAAEPGQAAGRNLMGFKDGTVNPDLTDDADMDAVVWVQPEDRQPEWAIGGTYQAIRVIRMQVEFWDRTRLNEQEAIFGRSRDTGAPLGKEFETDEPEFHGNFDSHIARANPRTPGSERNRLLRRPFSYAGGIDGNHQLDQGLIFVCYQRSLNDGFIAVQERLNGEALEEYIRPVGGGFFFVPPGPPDAETYIGAGLLEG